MKKILVLSLILALFSGSFNGCKKDTGEPPLLPPAESMLIDFSNFVSTVKSSLIASENKGTENLNWETAALIAGTWRILLNVTFAIPVASFKATVNQDPVFLSDNTWQWSNSASVSAVTYKTRLTGQIRTNDVLWKMYITREGIDGFPEFMWFEGTSKLDGSGGQWKLSQSYQVQTPVLQIDWTKSGSALGEIIYTYIKNDVSKDSYIKYGLTNNPLNAYFKIHYYNSSLAKFSDVDIEWSTSTKNGRIKSSDFLEGIWYCWDANRINVECAP